MLLSHIFLVINICEHLIGYEMNEFIKENDKKGNQQNTFVTRYANFTSWVPRYGEIVSHLVQEIIITM